MSTAEQPMEFLVHGIPEPKPAEFWDGVARSYIPGRNVEPAGEVRLHEAAAERVDPVTDEVVRYALLNANFEHAALIQRLCVSPITMLTRDFQATILSERGDLVCLGPNLQYFSTSHEMTVKWTLEHRSANPGIRDDDIFLANDPYVGAPHQSDTCIYAPVFVDGELFCWVANSMHLADVGGSVQGSFCVTAADAWGDPPSFPPVRLVEAGELRADVEELFVRQSRLPAAVRMDMRAAISAAAAARERLVALAERYGADVVKAVMRRMLDAGEELARERLATIPDGRWSHRAFTEAALPGDRAVYAYQVNVTKQDGRLIIDNAGTDPQTGSINVTYAAFAGCALAATVSQLASELGGAYGGVYRLVELRPEPGLLSCADHPAAVSPSGAFTTEMLINATAIAIGKMLACARDADVAGRALGPNLPHFYGAIGGGLDASGQLFILANTNGMMGALGGMPQRDGADCGGHFWIPEGIAYNVEDLEDQYPILYLYRRLLAAGADGAGRRRGGLGFVEASLPWRSPFVQMQVYANESFPKGQGQLGANPGSRASFRSRANTDVVERLAAGDVPQALDALAGEDEAVGFKGPPLTIGPAHVWEWSSPSAAGWGDPLLRDPELVAEDVRAGRLAPDVAERVYGVVVRDGDADTDASERVRAAERRRRLGREPAPPAPPPQGARRIGDLLHVVDGRWWCNGADLGPTTTTYKAHAALEEIALRDLAPEFASPDPEMADKIVARAWYCPVTGYRLDLELSRAGEPPLVDIVLGQWQ